MPQGPQAEAGSNRTVPESQASRAPFRPLNRRSTRRLPRERLQQRLQQRRAHGTRAHDRSAGRPSRKTGPRQGVAARPWRGQCKTAAGPCSASTARPSHRSILAPASPH
eukprot:3921372-Prymnesium_polylepis.2